MKWKFARSLALAAMCAAWTAFSCSAAGQVVLPGGTRITLQLNNTLSTDSNREGETFTAVVTTPVYLKDRMVIPKGSVVNGSISRILQPGRFKGKAVMNLLFQSISIPGRGQLGIVATLVRIDDGAGVGIEVEGNTKGKDSGRKDAGRMFAPGPNDEGTPAATGRGVTIGGAAGLTTVYTLRGNNLEVHRGSTMDIMLERPLTIPFEGSGPESK